MRLLQMKLKNFRGYKNETILNIGDITSIIGKNDVGKSTLLEALEIFFNNKVVKIEQDDCNVHSSGVPVEITCVFDRHSQELIIDSTSKTTLSEECLLNNENNLEIVKRYNCSNKTPKESIFVKAYHPFVADLADLLQLKKADLKKRAEKVGADLSNVDERSNVALRKAIRDAIPDEEKNYQLIDIDLSKEDGKQIWDKLLVELPVFAIFQSDRKSQDDDSEVQDPMKIAVQEALKTVQSEMDAIKDKVEKFALDVAERTLKKLNEMSPELASSLNPRFKAEPKYDGFKLSLTGDSDIPINKRGSGVRRLILLNFFRAEAERRQREQNSPSVIYAIEEPENSQHPSNQKMLIKSLIELSNRDNCQVIITTHVPAVAGLLPEDSIRYISKDSDGNPIVNGSSDALLENVAQQLGILPDKRVKLIVCVEGPSDIEFLEHSSLLLNSDDNSLPCLRDNVSIAMVSLGGGTLKHWVNKHYLRNLNIPEFHIYDRDEENPPKYQDAANNVNNRKDGSQAILTTKREIENYIHPEAIKEVTEISLSYGDMDDVGEMLAKETHSSSNDTQNPWDSLSNDKKREKIKNAKKRLCGEILKKMTLDMLNQQDTNGEIKGWLKEMNKMIS